MRFFLVATWALLALLAAVAPWQAQGAKILTVLPFSGRSQYIFMEKYLHTLVERGHELTVVTPLNVKQLKNMRVIEAPEIQKFMPDMLAELNTPMGPWALIDSFDVMTRKICECILEDPGMQQLMRSGETFDLYIAETVQTEVLFGLAQHFNATMMGVSSYGADWYIDELMGNISPLSYNPLITSPRLDRMSYCERLENMFEYLVEAVHRQLVHLPNMQQMYDKYFPKASQTMTQALDSFSLMLLGQHFTLSYPRPYVPNMIEIGGMHIAHKPAQLPENVKQFIETAPAGVIYFSLGSNLRSKDLPQETLQVLLNAFAGLKQRVLWKFEDDQLPGKPKNVLIGKWFPQSDILAHTNVKLFITHGGLLSTVESIYHGKAVLGLPVFYDQFMNVQRAERMGFGKGLDLKNLKQTQLEQTINQLLSTPKYADAAARISKLYRDQPEPSLDRAIWWTEYVIRHKGAPHMRAASRALNLLQLHSVDTLALLLGLPVLVLIILIYIIIRLLRWYLAGKQKRGDKQKKH